MKSVYPVILTKEDKFVTVYVPDFDINTEGEDFADAMEMARDAIGLMGIDMEDEGKLLPTPSTVSEAAKQAAEGDVTTLVDIDFSEYRRKNDMRTVRRNVSLPCWLNDAADRAGLNVSAVLQRALKAELGA